MSCVYSGRFVVVYRLLGLKVFFNNLKGKFLNMWVVIYECEFIGSEFCLIVSGFFFFICFFGC